MSFPYTRPRRMRRTPALRSLIRETEVRPGDLIAPLFVKEGIGERVAIGSMPGQFQHTLESLRKEAVEIAERGVRGFILFAVPTRKDEEGSEAWNPDGIGQQAIHALREEFGDEAVVISDLCLDEYTDHGHCGVLNERGEVDNDATVELYRRIAVAQAEAGAHLVGPSGMMDGQVAAIRSALDEGGQQDVGILAYAAKFASPLYGPFREAAEGAPRFARRITSRYGSAGFTITMSAPSSMSVRISRRASSAFAGSCWYPVRSPKRGAPSAASRNGP